MIGSNSSINTIMTTVNTMLGSSMLILPIIFADIGLLTGIIVLTIICITNFITANILLRHGKSSEDDLPEMIYRILGTHFFRLQSLIASFLCFFIGVVYYLLCCSMVYNILAYILFHLNIKIADKSIITFSEPSMTYVAVVLIVI